MLVIMIAAFILTFSVLQFQTHIFKRQTERVLVSLKILERQIQKFGDTEELREEIDFRELEDIRLELSRTKSNLSETRGLLASQRAKEINAEVYKRLIHDLQNPISAMNTMITLISESDTPDDIKHEALDTLPKLTQEILSQIIATKKNFEYDASQFVNTDLRLCINESLIQIKLSHPEKFKKISFIDPSHSILIPCDPPSLKRAIINVIENGLDFSREKLEIRLSESKDGASIFIADDGPGLQKEKLEEIIRGLSKSGKGDRPALGLSSVSHILRKHNGRLSCQGSHLGGAEFELSLGII
jgi:K+-sensing histidine kinase KdpD